MTKKYELKLTPHSSNDGGRIDMRRTLVIKIEANSIEHAKGVARDLLELAEQCLDGIREVKNDKEN